MTPHNYTAWGLQDCSRDTSNPGFGSMLGRLFLRTLPSQYTSNSTYTWFPLMTPEAMKGYTAKMGIEERYNFNRPGTAPSTHIISGYEEVKRMLEETSNFRPPYADRVGAMVKGQGYVYIFSSTLKEYFAHTVI